MLRRRGQSVVRYAQALLGVAAAALAGCEAAFDQHRAELQMLYGAGRFDRAAAMLDDPKTRQLYGSKNGVLWELDRGSVGLALKEHDKTIELLNRAEDTIEVQREKSVGDVIGQWMLNDTATAYIAEPYEDMYLNVIKILAQLEAGRIDGGATVEARRMAGKADRLRDLYLKYEEAVERQGASLPADARESNVVAVNRAHDFVESPLGTYLTAVTFMKSGDREFQRVAGKRLVDSIRLQEGLIGPVQAEDFADLGDLNPDSANVLVVALSGRGPTKYAERVGPIPLGTVPVYLELPYLRTYPSEVTSARLEVEGGSEPAASLRLVEDLSAVAAENHLRILPLIRMRTMIRYAIKAGISVGLTEGARRRSKDRDQGLVQVAGVLAGLAILAATEKADLRCWLFLPGQARVGLSRLEPGRQRVRVVYEGFAGGAVYESPWQEIDVSEGGLTSVVTHCWR